MNCQECQATLSLYLEGELSPQEREAVEKHLSGCSTCSAEVEGIRQMVSQLKALPKPPVPPGFRQSVWEKVDAPVGLEKFRRWIMEPWYVKIPVGALATVTVAILVVQVTKKSSPELFVPSSAKVFQQEKDEREDEPTALDEIQASSEEISAEDRKLPVAPPKFPPPPETAAAVPKSLPSAAPSPVTKSPGVVNQISSAGRLRDSSTPPKPTVPTSIQLQVADVAATEQEIPMITEELYIQEIKQDLPNRHLLIVRTGQQYEKLLSRLSSLGKLQVANPMKAPLSDGDGERKGSEPSLSEQWIILDLVRKE